MSITIELEPEAEEQLRQLAAKAGAYPETLVKQWIFAHIAPAPKVPNDLASVYGKWPDAPSDAELNEELSFLSRQNADNSFENALAALRSRTPEQIAEAHAEVLAHSRRAKPLPPGQTLEDMVFGKWPGDETDEEVNAALEAVS